MSADLELLGHRTGNCLRAAIALEEAGLDYSVRRIDLAAGEHKGAAFRSLNPSGKVPVLIDRRGDESGLVIAQSNAIMLHVAEATPGTLMPAAGAGERARFFERLFYFLLDVIAPSHAAFALRSDSSPGAADLLSGQCRQRFEAAERFLDDTPFLAGDRFTLVDIAAFTIARSIEEAVDWNTHPRLREWFEASGARPKVLRGFHAFDGDHA